LKGALDGYVFWGFRRLAVQVPYFIVPFVTGYAVYSWGKTK
jgi:ubiquinol-cytochrome c reductase subunit 8